MPNKRLDVPEAVFYDVPGTLVNTTFVSTFLEVFVRRNTKVFLINNWTNEQIKRDVANLREIAHANEGWPKVASPDLPRDNIQDSIDTLVQFMLNNKIECKEFAEFR